MSIVARLVEFAREMAGPGLDPTRLLDVTDERLATAALLVHVARADGRVDPGEQRALIALLGSGFDLSPEAAGALVARAGRLDHEIDDVAGLVEMLGHVRHEDERRRLLAMAYAVAAADGSVGEFEADMIWRMGCMLGFDDRAIEAVRAESMQGNGPQPTGGV